MGSPGSDSGSRVYAVIEFLLPGLLPFLYILLGLAAGTMWSAATLGRDVGDLERHVGEVRIELADMDTKYRSCVHLVDFYRTTAIDANQAVLATQPPPGYIEQVKKPKKKAVSRANSRKRKAVAGGNHR